MKRKKSLNQDNNYSSIKRRINPKFLTRHSPNPYPKKKNCIKNLPSQDTQMVAIFIQSNLNYNYIYDHSYSTNLNVSFSSKEILYI